MPALALPYVYSALTTIELTANPAYDPNANKSGWELFWEGVKRSLANLSDAQKCGIVIGMLLVLLACMVVTIMAPEAAAAVAAMGRVVLEFVIGVVSAAAISAVAAVTTGGDVAEEVVNTTADAILICGIFAFVSAGISAIKAGVRSVRSSNPKSVIKDGVEIQRANQADFTPDAWEEIQRLQHNFKGETVSSTASGRRIHSGFRTDLIGHGKESIIKGVGRADAIEKNIIYELKPNNARSIARGIKQLKQYNNALGNSFRMVLILY